MNERDLIWDIWVTDFTEDAAVKFSQHIFDLARENPNRAIAIYISSYGGEVEALATMVGAMKAVKNQKITIAIGKAMSCGAILLAAGDTRCASEDARIMIHEGSSGAIGNIRDIKTTVEEHTYLDRKWSAFLAERCGKTLEQLEGLFSNHRRDIYMSAQEALDFGLITHIGVPLLVTSEETRTEALFSVDPICKPKAAVVAVASKKEKKGTK